MFEAIHSTSSTRKQNANYSSPWCLRPFFCATRVILNATTSQFDNGEPHLDVCQALLRCDKSIKNKRLLHNQHNNRCVSAQLNARRVLRLKIEHQNQIESQRHSRSGFETIKKSFLEYQSFIRRNKFEHQFRHAQKVIEKLIFGVWLIQKKFHFFFKQRAHSVFFFIHRTKFIARTTNFKHCDDLTRLRSCVSNHDENTFEKRYQGLRVPPVCCQAW